eukprot:scaffold18569_cov60-Cyclotella_meneghiniana.AAC.9
MAYTAVATLSEKGQDQTTESPLDEEEVIGYWLRNTCRQKICVGIVQIFVLIHPRAKGPMANGCAQLMLMILSI